MDATTAASSTTTSSSVGGEASSHLHQRRGGSTGTSSGVGGAAASAGGAGAGEDSRFECNVCLDSPDEPVVTLCGHLFCWPCLYRWLSSQNQNTCPVCKAGVTKENVIPLYGRGTEAVDPRTKPRRREQGGESVPGRPQAQRPEARPQQGGGPGGGTYGAMPGFGVGGFPLGVSPRAGVSFSAGFGFFPSLFGLQFQTFTPPMPAGSGAGNQNMSADEAQQAFLSKLLLMLGIFTLGVLVFC